MNGILLIDKPKGWTSFDVVNKVRHIIQQSGLNTTGRKRFPVGHTGTLDPLATGLLVILVGNFTKKATELTKLDKVYEVTMTLGKTSTTGDEEGQKTQINTQQPTRDELQQVVEQFIGEVMQTPPAYSAIKINGQRAYKLARQGKEVKLEPRKATIHGLKINSYKYPVVKFTAKVSSGTYIRSLVEDIGMKLDTGAYMSDLRRTKVGDFNIEKVIRIDNLSPQQIYDSIIN